MTSKNKPDDITIVEGNCAMREVVGDDFKIGTVLTPEKIAACQKLIEGACHQFFTDNLNDLKSLESIAAEILTDGEKLHDRAAKSEAIIYNIQGQAGLFGFRFISQICTQLLGALGSEKLSVQKKCQVYGKLVQALRLAYDQKITDDGRSSAAHILLDLGVNL